ncbi:MAG: methylated-DNA--[protein]-cysteine S-methyltransferase [Acidobacteria bacterium]|nr:methylated-DNA--[protein]-cysteine S-methyltransferase [Acidobacteriota bacterium]
MLFLFHPTPIGDLLVAGDGNTLSLIGFPQGKGRREPHPDWNEDSSAFAAVRRQLDAYFSGTLRRFDIPLAPRGTEFQLAVWEALTHIPYGETITYSDLAIRIGNPAAVRAVGAANGANPIPIVVPCHRVIGADGSLTGFGGGLDTKRWLLRHEGAAGHREQAEQSELPFSTGRPT